MRSKSQFLRQISIVFLLPLVLCLVLLLIPVTSQAKTKTITIKNQDFTSSLSTARKKAAKAGVGTINIIQKKVNGWGNGYLRFTAPKTNTYSFTVSRLHDDGNAYSNGSVRAMKAVKSNNRNYLANTRFAANNNSRGYIRINSRIAPTSCTGKIKLNKGETIYLFFSFYGTNNKGKITSRLVIK